jgi:hypothetical protein
MPPVARPTGRPDTADSDARKREFELLILSGRDFAEAAQRARVKPIRALAILSADSVLLQAVAAVRTDKAAA